MSETAGERPVPSARPDPGALRARIALAVAADRPRLEKRLVRLRRQRRVAPARWRELAERIERSVARRAARAEIPLDLATAAALPIAASRAALAAAITAHPVVIVSGATGSGKTTQLPKLCLALGRGIDGLVGLTQPRRVAARSVAARLAHELGPHGRRAVGHQVRFDARVEPDCRIKVATDGILLAEIQDDPDLLAYDTVIVDEAHERTLNIDFLLGYLADLVTRRADLKVIVSSATIDTGRLSEFFGGAPVVEVSGRLHPVEVRYRPLDAEHDDMHRAVCEAVDELSRDGPGDILVFLPGERDIRAVSNMLRGRARAPGPAGRSGAVDVVPLYARLPAHLQDRVFAPHAGRRVVLATNVAETSVTVPGIRFVVDCGLARLARYSHRSAAQRLPVEPISQASAEQRKGRCGRLGPGVCIRLYDEEEFRERPEFTPPEIQRSNLAAVLLRLKSLGWDDVEDFPFLDPPQRRFVNDGMRMLRELGALDEEGALTRTGRRLVRLPVEPRVGRMIIEAEKLGCLREVLIIASALGVGDARERPPGGESQADLSHARFRDERSDFMTMLRLWRYSHQHLAPLGQARFRAQCRKRFLSAPRLREWQEVHAQLTRAVRDVGIKSGAGAGQSAYSKIHRALLTGLLRNVGARNGEREYAGVRDARFVVAGSSPQQRARHAWLVAAELVETSRLYAFAVASIRPEWVERAAGDLVRRTYFEAYWDARRAQPMVFEQVSLFGLTVVARRRVRFAPVSLPDARELFIRAGLVEGQFVSTAGFLADNARAVAALRALDDRFRRPDVAVSDGAVFAFYDALLPPNVCDAPSFEAWRRRAERELPERLRIDPGAFGGPAPSSLADYPDELCPGGLHLALRYRFEPGTPDDGVTAMIPVGALRALDPGYFEWLVPGLLAEKVTALLRLLPKAVRRELVPLPDMAARFLAEPRAPGRSLRRGLAEFIRASTAVAVPMAAWSSDVLARDLPGYLLMNFRVEAEGGGILAEGRDLGALQQRLLPDAVRATAPREAGHEGLRSWDFGDLEACVEVERQGVPVLLYPALVDRYDAVDIVRVESPAAAAALHGAGVLRLHALALGRDLRALEADLPALGEAGLAYMTVPEATFERGPAGGGERPDGGRSAGRRGDSGHRRFVRELFDIAIDAVLGDGSEEVRSAAEFATRQHRAHAAVLATAREVAQLVADTLHTYRAVRDLRHGPGFNVPGDSLADVDRQLGHLVYRGFLADVPVMVLRAYPRYLAGLQRRLEKLRAGGARDGEKLAGFNPLWERYAARARHLARRGRRDPELERYRWMLEEYRISLFAQELGTAFAVSRKRLDTQWGRVAA